MARIYVVDDDPEVVDLLVCLLEEEGYEVTGFTTAQAALRAMRQAPPALVLVDLLMPEIGGADLCRMLKGDPRTEHVRVLFVSGMGGVEREAWDAGADGFLQKPFDIDDVLRRVAESLEPAVRAAGAEQSGSERT